MSNDITTHLRETGNINSIETFVRISGALSLAGCIAMIIDILRNWKKLRNSPHRIVLYWTIADLMLTPASLIARGVVNNPTLCTLQGWLVEASTLASILWGAVLATNILMAVGLRRSASEILACEPYYHVLAWGLPLLVASLPPLLPLKDSVAFYGDAQLWCWISQKYDNLRMYFLYGPLWAIFLYCAGIYVYVGIKIWRHTKGSSIIEPTSGKSMDARKRYAFKASMYILALLIAWTPATINRIVQLDDRSLQPNDVLFKLHALSVPVQGTLNAFVYFSPRIYALRNSAHLPNWLRRNKDTSSTMTAASGQAVSPEKVLPPKDPRPFTEIV